MSELSANREWRNSGSTLSYAEWITREKAKGRFLLNKDVQDTINASLEEMRAQGALSNQTTTSVKPMFLGVDQRIWLVASVIIVVAMIYKYETK